MNFTLPNYSLPLKNMGNKIIFFTFLILLAISGSCWYAINATKTSLESHAQASNNPDFFMKDVSYLQMDSMGVLQNKISTPSLVHYQADSTYFFEAPTLEMLDKNDQLWTISAAHGKSIHESDTVYLWDDVKVKQFDKKASVQKSLITTSTATIYPHRKFAETDKPLAFHQGDSVVYSTGAKLDLEAAKVQLLSKVKGQYETGANDKT